MYFDLWIVMLRYSIARAWAVLHRYPGERATDGVLCASEKVTEHAPRVFRHAIVH